MPDSRQAVRDREYLTVSALWLLVAAVDAVRAAKGMVNPGRVFSTPSTIWLSAALHAGIGGFALLHEEPFYFLAGGLCYIQVGVAVVGIPFILQFNGVSAAPNVAIVSLVLLGALAVAQAVLMADAQD